MSANLIQLVDRGDPDAIRFMLDNAAPPVKILNQALWEAVRGGKQELISLLIDHGANIKSKDKQTGWSLLHSAVEHHQTKSIQELLRLGADIHARDPAGATPLHLACDLVADAIDQLERNPDLSVVRMLLEMGADPNIGDDDGKTPRDWASEAGIEELTSLLRGAGA